MVKKLNLNTVSIIMGNLEIPFGIGTQGGSTVNTVHNTHCK